MVRVVAPARARHDSARRRRRAQQPGKGAAQRTGASSGSSRPRPAHPPRWPPRATRPPARAAPAATRSPAPRTRARPPSGPPVAAAPPSRAAGTRPPCTPRRPGRPRSPPLAPRSAPEPHRGRSQSTHPCVAAGAHTGTHIAMRARAHLQNAAQPRSDDLVEHPHRAVVHVQQFRLMHRRAAAAAAAAAAGTPVEDLQRLIVKAASRWGFYKHCSSPSWPPPPRRATGGAGGRTSPCSPRRG